MFSDRPKYKCIIGQGANTDVCPIVDWRLTRETQMSSMALSPRSAPGYICDETSPPLPLTCTILLPKDHCCIGNSTDIRKYNYKFRHKYKKHLCCTSLPLPNDHCKGDPLAPRFYWLSALMGLLPKYKIQDMSRFKKFVSSCAVVALSSASVVSTRGNCSDA